MFSDALGGGHYKYVAEAVSHEAGHTLDLQHDGLGSSSYYGGHSLEGGGGWAPIMGVGYTQAITQWSDGDYPGSTTQQDDIAILASHLGWASSGSGGSTVVGPPTLSDGDSYVGTVEQSNVAAEVDVSVPAGVTSIAITPAATLSNLVVRAELLRGNSVIAATSPASAANWRLNFEERLTAGVYTVRLSSIGWGTVSSSELDGFTSYGSIGQFLIEVDVIPDSTTVTTTAPSTTTPGGTTPPTTTPPTTAPATTTPPTTPATNQLTTTRPASCTPTARGGLMGLTESQAAGQPCFSGAERL